MSGWLVLAFLAGLGFGFAAMLRWVAVAARDPINYREVHEAFRRGSWRP